MAAITNEELGRRIRAARDGLKMSQAAFANALGAPGSQGDISEWELGKKRPSYRSLTKISRLTGISLSDLGEEETEEADAVRREALLIAAARLEGVVGDLRAEATSPDADALVEPAGHPEEGAETA